jgi:hypothetical protein
LKQTTTTKCQTYYSDSLIFGKSPAGKLHVGAYAFFSTYICAYPHIHQKRKNAKDFGPLTFFLTFDLSPVAGVVEPEGQGLQEPRGCFE